MKEITTCEVADSVEAFKCITEEQCDDCFMKDHLKECAGCEHYDHPEAPSVDELIDYVGKKTGFKI